MSDEIAVAEAELAEIGEAIAAATRTAEELAAGEASDHEIDRVLNRRSGLERRAERLELRLKGLRAAAEARDTADQREQRRAEAEGLLDRAQGWLAAFLEAGREADEAMAALAEALERRACCAKEVMAIAPRELRELEKLAMPVWLLRAAAYHGLASALALQHPWSRDKQGPLSEDRDQAVMRDVDRVLARLRAEREGEAA